MKILAIGASNSRHSINRVLAAYAANSVEGASVEVIDINEFELPLFSIEREAELGQPELAKKFHEKIGSADGLVIAFAEHNGSYTAAWKNLFDWVSRIDTRVFQGKPSVYLSTSPGARGAATVLASAVQSAPHFGAELVGSLSIPAFQQSFSIEADAFRDEQVARQVGELMSRFREAVQQRLE